MNIVAEGRIACWLELADATAPKAVPAKRGVGVRIPRGRPNLSDVSTALTDADRGC